MKTEKISKAIEMVTGAREDIKNHWNGNSDARESADHQLSIALSYLEDSQSDDDRLKETVTDARTTIGTFFQDLKEIYEPKEGNLKL